VATLTKLPFCLKRWTKFFFGEGCATTDRFTVVCSVTRPLDDSEAGVGLVLLQTSSSLLLWCKCTKLASEQLVLHNKSSEVFIKTRSPSASLPSKGQVTKQTTVKWSIRERKKRQKIADQASK